MIGKEFFNSVANGQHDIIQTLLDIFDETDTKYCVIDGLAVNAYVDPVVSLDIDIVVAVDDIETTSNLAKERGLKVEPFEHSINISSPASELRIQLQTDSRYQAFVSRAQIREVLGYRMSVALLEDVLQGKVWAYMDQTHPRSKRQKDMVDIVRILETYPQLETELPKNLQEELEKNSQGQKVRVLTCNWGFSCYD